MVGPGKQEDMFFSLFRSVGVHEAQVRKKQRRKHGRKAVRAPGSSTSNTREYANKLAGLLVRLAPGRLEKLYILSEGVGLAVSMSGECLELSRGRVVLGLMATAKLNRKGVQHRSGHS